jgi:hypothetical protein
MSRADAKRAAEVALDVKPAWRPVSGGTCVADIGEFLLVRVQDAKTYGNPKGKAVVFALHKAEQVVFGRANDGYTAGHVAAINVRNMPPNLRAALVTGLVVDPAGKALVAGEAPRPPAPPKETPVPQPQKPAAPVFPVRQDEKKLVITQRTFTVDIKPEKLLELLRAAGVDVPADAQVQLAWSDREGPGPYLASADVLHVSWSRTDESEG